MLRTVTTEQMRIADRRCIVELGIPGAVLMENAGRAVFQEIPGGPVGIVCGKGNNGGDGFVTARHAYLAGMETRVVLLADPDTVSGDAALYMHVFQRLGGTVQAVQREEDVPDALESLHDCATLVDAILGTGVKGPLQGLPRVAAENWPAAYTVSVDVPTGLDADSGQVAGPAIPASVTVAIQFAKRGFTNAGAAPWLGRLVVADIGIPEVCADDAAWAAIRTRR